MTTRGPGRYLVLVTGSRTWADDLAVTRALSEILDHLGGGVQMAVMHGSCPSGADAIADLWCAVHQVEALRRPADWDRYGKRAGGIRNSEMIAEILGETGADSPRLAGARAFLDACRAPRCRRPKPHGSHGTADCIAKITAAGIPLQTFRSPALGPAGPRPAQTRRGSSRQEHPRQESFRWDGSG